MIRPPLDTVTASGREKTTVTSPPRLELYSLLGPVSSHLASHGSASKSCLHTCAFLLGRALLLSLPDPVQGRKQAMRRGEGANTMREAKQDSAYPVRTAAWHPPPLPLCPCQHGATLRDRRVRHYYGTERGIQGDRWEETKEVFVAPRCPVIFQGREGLQRTGDEPVLSLWVARGDLCTPISTTASASM